MLLRVQCFVLHVFIFCNVIYCIKFFCRLGEGPFTNSRSSFLKVGFAVLNASLLDILFGKFDLEKDFLLVNHIFLLAKYFIYKCKLSQVIPTLLVFKAKLKATYKVELYIAKEKGILPNHYKKWDNFLSWLS